MTDNVPAEAESELPPSRRMKLGQELGAIHVSGARLSASVVRGLDGFELHSPVLNRAFGFFSDEGREPELPGFWNDEIRQSVIEQFQALIEEYDRYPQIRRYEETAAEREAIGKFLAWLRSEPRELLDQRPLKRGWLVKNNLVAAVNSCAVVDLDCIVLDAVGIDAMALDAEVAKLHATVKPDQPALPVFSRDQLDDPRYVKFDVLGSTPENQA